MMPGINGFETCRILKSNKNTADIPVIFMTALSDTADKIKGFNAGGVDYITKPLQHEEVLARINAHLTIRILQYHLKLQNLRLEDQNKSLEELNANKDKFFSIISHDMRNLFQALLWNTEFLLMKLNEIDKEEIKRFVESLHSSSKNLYALLENLLIWSRMKRGLVEYAPQNIDVRHVLTQHIALFSDSAAQKQITLVNSIQETSPIFADVNMVNVLMRNLISNAIKFTNPGGKVDISTKENHRFVEIAVSDSGIGIEEEKLFKLFRIDVTHRNTGTAGEQGTGLGLILCKEIVEKNHGTIRVKSQVNQGTAFFVEFPKHSVEALSSSPYS
jgi:signal transduction histidine kinase